MDLRYEIRKEHSKIQCTRIVSWVGGNQEKFDELFHLFLHDEYRVIQRAAWPLSYCAIAHPNLMRKNFDKLVKNLQKPNLHDAVKRNTVRVLQEIDIPRKYHGVVMDICFRYLESVNEATAVKVYSLGILGKLAKQYPEIIPEIKLLAEDRSLHQRPAFKSKAKAFLKLVALQQ